MWYTICMWHMCHSIAIKYLNTVNERSLSCENVWWKYHVHRRDGNMNVPGYSTTGITTCFSHSQYHYSLPWIRGGRVRGRIKVKILGELNMIIKVEILVELYIWLLKLRFGWTMTVKVEILVELWLLKLRFWLNYDY